MPASRFQVGPWLADPAANELVRDGETVRVEPKMIEVLVALAERPGETVTRDDLLERVWPGMVVTEDALSGAVSKLRRVLGDDARQPRFIETIPRTGYRLVAPVTPAADLTAALPEVGERPAPRPRPRLLLAALGLAGLLALAWALQREAASPAAATVRPVTRSAGVERYPDLDTSGKRLAFAARSRDSTFYHLFVQDLDTETPLQLTRTRADDIYPVWNPDGQTVAFLRCLDLRCHVYTAPVLGGTPRRRAEASVSPYGLAWLSDRAVLVVDRDSVAAPYRLLRLDLDTGERTVLTNPPRGALGDLAPALGPDGTVAFVRHGTGGDEDLYVLPPDAPSATPLTNEQSRIAGFAWDGDDLVFSARREGTVGLWRVDPNGTITEAVASGLRDPGMLAARSGRIVAESRTVEVNLWEAVQEDAGAYTTRPLVVSVSADREPALSPDGARLAFVSDRSGTPELWTARRDGSALLRLTDFGGAGLGAPVWLADGRIAFEVQREGQADLFAVSAEGGTPEPLTDEAGYDVAPRPSRDGRSLYFGSDRSGDWEVWKLPFAGGPPVQVTDAGGFAAHESSDGRMLYFTRYFENGLWAMPTEGGTPRQVLDALDYRDWGNWTVTASGIVWLDRTADSPRLVLHALLDGADRELLRLDDIPAREVGFSATPDGRVLTIARTERVESDLVLIEVP